MKLRNKKLELISITRQTIETASIAVSCDNCNKTIINIAHVKCEDNINYHIGLDCKATLFDEKKKEEKTARRDIEKFLKLSTKNNVEFEIDHEIVIYDNDQLNDFGIKGEIIYMENLNYLIHNGLDKDYVTKLVNNKPRR